VAVEAAVIEVDADARIIIVAVPSERVIAAISIAVVAVTGVSIAGVSVTGISVAAIISRGAAIRAVTVTVVTIWVAIHAVGAATKAESDADEPDCKTHTHCNPPQG
jgi:hypothetical protein